MLDDSSESFRLANEQIFLTYANVKHHFSLEHFRTKFFRLLGTLDKKVGLVDYVIAREYHKSKVPHFHIYTKFDGRFETINPRIFDFSHYSKVYHPNFSAVKNKHKVINYCTKGKEFITNMESKDMYPRWRVLLEDYHKGKISEYEFRIQLMYDMSPGSAAGFRNIERLMKIFPDDDHLLNEISNVEEYVAEKLK